jgi:hypothetical protein
MSSGGTTIYVIDLLMTSGNMRSQKLTAKITSLREACSTFLAPMLDASAAEVMPRMT